MSAAPPRRSDRRRCRRKVRERAASMLSAGLWAIPDEGIQFHVRRVAARTRTDSALPREKPAGNKAPGRAPAASEPDDVIDQVATAESGGRRGIAFVIRDFVIGDLKSGIMNHES